MSANDGRPRRRRRPPVDRGPRPLGESLDDAVAGLGAPKASPRQAKAPVAGDDASARSEDTTVPGERAAPPSAGAWAAVFGRWEEIVGPSLARHVRPLRLQPGVLVVAVDQPPWATQVRALSPTILARVADLAGERVARLEVVVRVTGR